jgi:hypothetical protein
MLSDDPDDVIPVPAERQNAYEFGIQQAFGKYLRLDVVRYIKNVRNFSDDEQLFTTAVVFPVAIVVSDSAGTHVDHGTKITHQISLRALSQDVTTGVRLSALLSVEHYNVVNVLALGILAAPRGRPCLSVFGHSRRNGHHYLPIFLLQGFDGVRVNPLYRNCVRIRDPSSLIAPSIKFRAILTWIAFPSPSVPVASIL